MNNSFATLCPKYAGLVVRKSLAEKAKAAERAKAVKEQEQGRARQVAALACRVA